MHAVDKFRLDIVLIVFLPCLVEEHLHFESLRPVFVLLLVILDVPVGEAYSRQHVAREDALIEIKGNGAD